MRLLGIDYGSKRIGLALSDDNKKIAFPYKTLDNGKDKNKVLTELGKIIDEELVNELVVGLPLSFSGEETAQSRQTRNFTKNFLGKLRLPIHFQNEMLTTKLAKNGASKVMLDASAAALILQDYIDKINPKYEARNPKQIQNNKL